MKTTLNLPDDLMTAIKVRAARENRTLKDIIVEALRHDLRRDDTSTRYGVRDIRPVSAGEVIGTKPEDRLEDMLEARGRRH